MMITVTSSSKLLVLLVAMLAIFVHAEDTPADSGNVETFKEVPQLTVVWDPEKNVHVTMLGNMRFLPGRTPSATPPPEPNDPPLPERPEANLVSAEKIQAYCDAAPKVSAPCALRKMCQSLGDAAPSYICGTTPLATLVCNKDKDMTTLGSKELCDDYNAKCTDEKCQNLYWPLFFPSSRYQTAIFKMCAWHANRNETMRGCGTCVVPPTGILTNPDDNDWEKLDTSCSSFLLYAEMCISMPGMGACAVWRMMCSTLPNASKIFPQWCDGDAMAARNIAFNASMANIEAAPIIQQAETSNSGAFMLSASFVVGGVAILAGMLAV